jgi:predicted amidohydrolase YtcJ
VTREQAFAAFTSGAPRAGFAEKRFGRLVPGERADFVLVDRDPLLASPDELRATKVSETWIGGQRVFVAP